MHNLMTMTGKPDIKDKHKLSPVFQDFLDTCLECDVDTRSCASELLRHQVPALRTPSPTSPIGSVGSNHRYHQLCAHVTDTERRPQADVHQMALQSNCTVSARSFHCNTWGHWGRVGPWPIKGLLGFV